MAEEDLIFGKNRHMFGGIEPSNMKKFSASTMGGKINLECRLPADTIIDGQMLCSVAGAIIRKKTDGFPVDEFDGEFIADIKSDLTIKDSNIELGNAYYYAAFPYSRQGVYNRSKSNRVMFDYGADHYVFGYDLNLEDENPETRVTYPSDVLNYNFAPAKMLFTEGRFNYGDWPDAPGNNFVPRPCVLSYAGEVLYYLNPNDYSKKYNSTESSNISSLSLGGNVMMEWPKIYTHREVVNGVYKFRCSDIKLEDDWDCWCNYDSNNNVIDHFYTSVYPCVADKTPVSGYTNMYELKLRSLSGKDIAYPTRDIIDQGGTVLDTSFGYFNCGVEQNNTSSTKHWSSEVLADRSLIQDLLVLMAKTTNCQSAYGMGAGGGASNITTNGTLDSKGLFWGSNGREYAVKVFGMENWWGNNPRLLLGLWANSYPQNGRQFSKFKEKYTAGTHDGSTGDDFFNYGYYLDTASSGDLENRDGIGAGFIKRFQYGKCGRAFPDLLGGSSSTYETDYLIMQTDFDSINKDFIPYVGYYEQENGYGSGPFCMRFYRLEAAISSGLCAALSFK